MGLFSFSSFARLWQTIELQPAAAYGWIPDPYDERDDAYEFDTTRAAKLSTNVSTIDNSTFFKPISMQSHFPACTANAGADYIEAVDIHDKVKSGVDLVTARAAQPDWSRMFLWANGRNEMDPSKLDDDTSGCFNRLIMDVAARFGVCEEKYWPYDEKVLPPKYLPRPRVRPSITAFRMARPNTIERYHALKAYGKNGDDRLEQIVKGLQANPGVLFGTALGPEFGSIGDGVLQIPKTIVARHALVFCGYDRQKAAFLVRNSHGTGFGFEGYCWMHESYVAWSKTNSLWMCTKGAL